MDAIDHINKIKQDLDKAQGRLNKKILQAQDNLQEPLVLDHQRYEEEAKIQAYREAIRMIDAIGSNDCTHCEGEGKFELSDCCQDSIIWENRCSDCKEPCIQAKCEHCDGVGYFKPTYYYANAESND